MNEEIECGVQNTWPAFLSRRKHEFYFIRYDGSDHLRVNRRTKKAGENIEYFYDLRVLDVDSDELKALGIWDKLSQEVKDKSLRVDDGEVVEAKERMENARKHRKGKYIGIPDQVACSNCFESQKMAKGVIVKNAEKWALKNGILPDVEKWIKQWQCQKCRPTPRGKKPSHNLPQKIELVCMKKCGKKVVYPASIVAKIIAKKGITLDFYVKNFVCQSCFPTKGRPKKSK
jgi:hypothetical protein